MKEVKSSFGSAVRTLRGNVLMRLLMMLEIPTASESSISILSEGEKDRTIMYLQWQACPLKGHPTTNLNQCSLIWKCEIQHEPALIQCKLCRFSVSLKIFVYEHKYLSCYKGRLVISTTTLTCRCAGTLHGFWEHKGFFPQKEQSRSAFLYAPNCGSNPYQMDLNCKQKSSITADWRTCRMVFRWCNWKNAPGIGDYRMAETERGRSGERETPTHYAYLFSNSIQQCMRECVCYLKLQRHQSIFIDIAENLQCEYLYRTMPTVSKLN